jgi:hypothetical protein
MGVIMKRVIFAHENVNFRLIGVSFQNIKALRTTDSIFRSPFDGIGEISRQAIEEPSSGIYVRHGGLTKLFKISLSI